MKNKDHKVNKVYMKAVFAVFGSCTSALFAVSLAMTEEGRFPATLIPLRG